MSYLAPGLSFDKWCKANNCEAKKLVFPYEWMDSYDKLYHVGPVKHEDFYSSLKQKNISLEEYEDFKREFKKRGCVTMMDWLREYNLHDVIPFREALEKTRAMYYPDKIDILKDAVSIPGVSMMYVLNKYQKMKKKGDPELFAPGKYCVHKCNKICNKVFCKKCHQILKDCKTCDKNKIYKLLKTGMVGGPSIIFMRYAELGKTKIRSNKYKFPKNCVRIVGYDANGLYLFAAGQKMPCGKGECIEVENPTDPEFIKKICKDILDGKLFGFCQVDINVPENLKEKFEEFSPLFVVDNVPEYLVPEHMKEYQKATGRKHLKDNKKLLGVTNAKEILLYTELIEWYLNHGLEITAIHNILKYEPGTPFEWFPEEVANARRDGDIEDMIKLLSIAFNKKEKDKVENIINELKQFPDVVPFIEEHIPNGAGYADKDIKVLIEKLRPKYKGCKALADTYKLKGNSFYGKMIEDKEKHKNTKYTQDEREVEKDLRSPFFEDLNEINETYEIIKRKKNITIDRPYQCGIAVYQLAKLRMLEFYYDFLDKYVDRKDFELIQMDTDSMYMAISAEKLDNIIKPEMQKEYFNGGKEKFLSTSKYHEKTPGLFKLEFDGVRMIAISSKCYYAEDENGKVKYSCKGTIHNQNEMTWDRYMSALNGSIDMAKNTGFRVNDNQIVTYTQIKKGLNAYYDKRIVDDDGIHTYPVS